LLSTGGDYCVHSELRLYFLKAVQGNPLTAKALGLIN
jgi:hypothetical protein